MQRIYDSRGGKAYDATFGERMRGSGHFADLINQRFHIAYKRLGFSGSGSLDCSRFNPLLSRKDSCPFSDLQYCRNRSRSD